MPEGQTILLVEDEPGIRGLMKTALVRAGYHVIEARTGREAVLLFENSVDLLLVDMRLPHLGGGEVIQRLREQRPTLKVLAMSGYPPNAPLDTEIRLLAKPFRREELLEAVRAVLQ